MELPILGGAYSARSVIANAQRCINYFPEINRRDAPAPFTLYQRPGRRLILSPPTPGQGRAFYRASNGQAFAVVEQSVYYIDAGLNFVLLGVLVVPSNSQVSFSDNAIDIMLVDGSAFGYTINLASHAFAQIFDPTGSFTGATQVAYLDTFILYNYPGTRFFGSTLSNTISFDALYIAGKDGYPDSISGLIVNRKELLLFGTLKASEIWYTAGGVAFPFERLPGAYIEHGCHAPFSISCFDLDTFWLGIDSAGDCMVFRLRGYDISRVSSHALELAMQKMKAAGADLSKTVGFIYQQNGHVFYVLNFVSGNQTWVFDANFGDDPNFAWHQECWQNPAGGAEMMRDGAMVFAYDKNLSLDRVNGDLYELDQNLYVDQVEGVDCPIVCVRGFPHITSVPGAGGAAQSLDGKRIEAKNFRLNLEVGLSLVDDQVVELRWSWDRGQTFGNAVLQSAGSPGQYMTSPLWTQLGAQGRDLVIEMTHQINGPAALQGAWLDVTVLNT